MTHRVIKRSNQPIHVPVGTTVLLWLVLDRLHAAGWVQGVAWTMMALLWAGAIYSIWTEEEVDVLKKPEGKP